jgi:hypothetical protein
MAIPGKIIIRQSAEYMYGGLYDPKKHPPRKFEEIITKRGGLVFVMMKEVKTSRDESNK